MNINPISSISSPLFLACFIHFLFNEKKSPFYVFFYNFFFYLFNHIWYCRWRYCCCFHKQPNKIYHVFVLARARLCERETRVCACELKWNDRKRSNCLLLLLRFLLSIFHLDMNIWKMIFKREHGTHQIYIYISFSHLSAPALTLTLSLSCSTTFRCHHSFFFLLSELNRNHSVFARPSSFVPLHDVKLMYYTLMCMYVCVFVCLFVCLNKQKTHCFLPKGLFLMNCMNESQTHIHSQKLRGTEKRIDSNGCHWLWYRTNNSQIE